MTGDLFCRHREDAKGLAIVDYETDSWKARASSVPRQSATPAPRKSSVALQTSHLTA